MEGKVFLRLVRRAHRIHRLRRRMGRGGQRGPDRKKAGRWWRTDKGAEDVRYVQFMGKDNVPFHTLSFPATILGSGEPWKLVDYSQVLQLPELRRRAVLHLAGARRVHGPGDVDPAARLLALVAPVPRARNLGTRNFTWEAFQQDVNKDLADVLGKFREPDHEGSAAPSSGKRCRRRAAMARGKPAPADRRSGGCGLGTLTRRIWTPSRSARRRPSCARSGSRATNTCKRTGPGPCPRKDPTGRGDHPLRVDLIPYITAGSSSPLIPGCRPATMAGRDGGGIWPGPSRPSGMDRGCRGATRSPCRR